MIENTTWAWSDEPDAPTVTFRSGGIAIFSHWEDGRWKLKGDRLQFDCNQYTMYDVIIDGDSMRGEWYRIPNPTERSWTALRKRGKTIPNKSWMDRFLGR